MEHGIKNCYYADTVMFACLARILLVYPYLISTKHCGCPMARSQGFTNFVTLTAAVLTLIAALIGLRAVLIQTERIYNPTPIPTLQIAAVTEISSETPRPTESSTPTQTLEPTITDETVYFVISGANAFIRKEPSYNSDVLANISNITLHVRGVTHDGSYYFRTFAYLTPRPPLQYLERGRKTHLEVPSPCNGEGI